MKRKMYRKFIDKTFFFFDFLPFVEMETEMAMMRLRLFGSGDDDFNNNEDDGNSLRNIIEEIIMICLNHPRSTSLCVFI